MKIANPFIKKMYALFKKTKPEEPEKKQYDISDEFKSFIKDADLNDDELTAIQYVSKYFDQRRQITTEAIEQPSDVFPGDSDYKMFKNFLDFIRDQTEFEDEQKRTNFFYTLRNALQKIENAGQIENLKKHIDSFSAAAQPLSPAALRAVIKRAKEEEVKFQDKPPLINIVKETEDEGGIEVEKTVAKIDEVYLEGNDFFQKISKDKEQMGILQVLMIQNPSPKALAKFPPRKIKEVYKLLPELSLEKDSEMTKDLKRLYNYTIDNEKEVMQSFGISSTKYEQTWQNIKNGIETSSSEERHEIYNTYYRFFKQKKPKLLKFFTTGGQNLEEQLVKYLKPYLLEKFIRRKQYEKKN
jgi:hypothetical protein